MRLESLSKVSTWFFFGKWVLLFQIFRELVCQLFEALLFVRVQFVISNCNGLRSSATFSTPCKSGVSGYVSIVVYI